MPFIGVQPASALLSSADIQDGQIITAKVADDAITGAKIENNPTIAGTLNASAGLTTPTGHIIQVLNATLQTTATITSTSFVTTGLSLAITPSSTSSKVLINFTMPVYKATGNAHAITTIYRGTVSGTDLGSSSSWGFGQHYEPDSDADSAGTTTGTFLDSPSTSSSQTYTIGIRTNSGVTVYAMGNQAKATLTLMEVAP